jgi:hypothetical protein
VTRAASGGSVSISDPASLTEADAQRITAAAGTASGQGSYLLGVYYADANYGGPTLSVYGNGTCDGDPNTVDWGLPVMPAGWNDVISSFKSYSNCTSTIFENGNYGGASYTAVNSTYVGNAMNDRTSSIKGS